MLLESGSTFAPSCSGGVDYFAQRVSPRFATKTVHALIELFPLCSDSSPWQSLISNTLPIHERISLVTMIFSNPNQVNEVRNLSRKDAQDFIDKVDEVSSHVISFSGESIWFDPNPDVQVLDGLTPQIHLKCLHHLYEICGNQTLLARSLEIPLRYNPAEAPVYRSGFADVRKGQYQGREVAARVLRIRAGDDAQKIMSVSRWSCD